MKEIFIITKITKCSPNDEIAYYAGSMTPVWAESRFDAQRFPSYPDAQNTIIKSIVIGAYLTTQRDEMLQIEKLFVN